MWTAAAFVDTNQAYFVDIFDAAVDAYFFPDELRVDRFKGTCIGSILLHTFSRMDMAACGLSLRLRYSGLIISASVTCAV
jgi:hypothetical protein